jgi:hypothetical protein
MSILDPFVDPTSDISINRKVTDSSIVKDRWKWRENNRKEKTASLQRPQNVSRLEVDATDCYWEMTSE